MVGRGAARRVARRTDGGRRAPRARTTPHAPRTRRRRPRLAPPVQLNIWTHLAGVAYFAAAFPRVSGALALAGGAATTADYAHYYVFVAGGVAQMLASTTYHVFRCMSAEWEAFLVRDAAAEAEIGVGLKGVGGPRNMQAGRAADESPGGLQGRGRQARRCVEASWSRRAASPHPITLCRNPRSWSTADAPAAPPPAPLAAAPRHRRRRRHDRR